MRIGTRLMVTTWIALAAVCTLAGLVPRPAAAQEVMRSYRARTAVRPKIPPPPDPFAPAAPVDTQALLQRIRRRIQELSGDEHHFKVLVPEGVAPAVPGVLAPAIPAARPTPVPSDEGPTAAAEVAIDWTRSKSFTGAPYEAATHPNETEPSVAVRRNGDDIVVTANTFAALSSNRGASWNFVDPFVKFKPQPAGKEFFCDQVVLYDKPRDLMIWYMQHRFKDGEGNLVRLAVATGDKIHSQEYSLYDFIPTDINADWKNTILDYPDLTSDGTFAYVTLNVFNQQISQPFKGAVVLRIKLDDLRDLSELSYDIFTTVPAQGYDNTGNFGYGSLRGTRSVQPQPEMFFAAHAAPAQKTLRIFRWPNSSSTLTQSDATIGAWKAMSDGSGGTAVGPDGRGWLSRCDGRITAAWNSGDVIGFAWTAAHDWTDPQQEPTARFKNPHVRVALVKKDSLSAPFAEPHVFSDDTAFAYPAASVSAAGELGLTVAYGGKTLNASQATPFPSFAVGLLRADADVGKYVWKLRPAARGTTGPAFSPDWGDYLWSCADPTDDNAWFGAGFCAVHPDSGSGQVNEVFLVRFKREENIAAAPLPGNVLTEAVASPADSMVALKKKVTQLEERVRELERVLNHQSRPVHR